MSGTLMKSQAGKISGAVRRRKPGSPGGRTGIVSYCIRGPDKKSVEGHLASPQLIAALNAGLLVQELQDLQAMLDVPMEKLAAMLGISKATFHRRQKEGRLDLAESDRALRYARLSGQAIKVMASEEGARKWLNAPQFGLGGAVPLEYAKTEIGAREVENLLGRIEHGVYS
jgi:putative toxin-antitoxin system antitoxin component (TIGR02293 family)